MKKNLEKDFRKWILFNKQLTDFQKLYELYTAVDTQSGKGGVSLQQSDNEADSAFILEQEGYEPALEIANESDRKKFLEYLVQHYFPNGEIEQWYSAKMEEKDKNENHNSSTLIEQNKEFEFKVHPKETFYYKWRYFISITLYLLLAGFVINSFFTSLGSGILLALITLLVILFFALMRRIAHGFFIGLIKGASVKLNEQQYPEVYKIVKEQASKFDLNETPEVYVLYGNFNAFVTQFARKKYLVLQSEVLETAARGDFEVLKFVIGHELAHIKRQHLSQEKWLIPSLIVPFLRLAHSRGCEYTCDRAGYHFSAKGALEGILILAAGKEIYTKLNITQYIEDSNEEKSFWVWFSEKFLSHPHTFKRMIAIKNYGERGY